MSNSPGSSIVHVSRGLSSRYRLYVWVISSCAMMVIALLIWPLSVKQFRTVAQIQFTIDTSLLEHQMAKELISRGIANSTTDERLRDLIKELKAVHPFPNSLLQQSDHAELRNAIQVSTRPGRSANSIQLKISLIGKGMPDELSFVNRLTTSIATELVASPSEHLSGQLILEWSQAIFNELEQQNAMLAQASDMLNEQLDLAMLQRNSLKNDIQMQLASQAKDDPEEISTINLQHKIAQLYQVMQQQQAANGWPANHPEMLSYQARIQSLRELLDGAYQAGAAYRVRNQFYNASAQTDLTSAEGDTRSAREVSIEFPELDAASAIANSIQRQVDTNRGFHAQMMERVEGQWSRLNQKPRDVIRLDRLECARRSEPVNGAPQGATWWLISACAIVLGGILAIQFKPEYRDRKFRSQEQVSSVLAMPTIGTLRGSVTIAQPGNVRDRLLKFVFQGFEYLLLGLFGILILLMLINSDIFGEVMENPFQGISKVIWMLIPQL